MAKYVDRCRYNPTLGGTTDWTYSSAASGYQSPASAGIVNSSTYRYAAESADLSQWEIGYGAYNTGTGVLPRTGVLCNSSGTGTASGQSGAGTKINFSTVPQVAIVALMLDVPSLTENAIFTGTLSGTSHIISSAPTAAWGIDASGATVSIADNGNAALLAVTGAFQVTIRNVTANNSMGVYLMVAGNVILLPGSTIGSEFDTPTTTPAAGKSCIAYDAVSAYRIYNHSGGTATFSVVGFKL